MNNISVLIADDDLNKISVIIETMKLSSDQVLIIKQASNVQEAMEWLSKYEFHLLITDLLMPLKYDSSPDPRGGESLIKNMYRRKNKVKVPMYIIGLTQFDHLQNQFNGVWQVWHFDMASESWKIKIRDLIFHISLISTRIIVNKTETIFAEGPLDRDILIESFRRFFPKELELVSVETRDYGGGASWVERQLVIWAKSLTEKQEANGYLKAIGIFDNDNAGTQAVERVKLMVGENTAEAKTFSVIKCSYKFSPLLKSIRSKGLSFPTTMEEMISIDIWREAKAKSWLVSRDSQYYSIDSNILSLTKDTITSENLAKYGFDEDQQLISLYKIDDKYKDEFKKLTLSKGFEEKKQVLASIGYILQEVLIKLKIKADVKN